MLAVACRTNYSATLLCCRSSPFHSMQHRHVLHLLSLARSYSSDIEDAPSRPRRLREGANMIQTLHPSRLSSSDFVDASSKSFMFVRGPDCQFPFKSAYHGRNRFPEGTRGFLYYHSPAAGVPSAAGELRFRLTPGDDPASFDQGSDLQMETGLPWCITLLRIVAMSQNGSQYYQLIQKLLRDDGFVTPALLETCTAMLNANKQCPSCTRIIHSFRQLFYIRFDATAFKFYTLSMSQLQSLRHQGFYYDINKQNAPYSGSAFCWFERSYLPQHRCTRTAVIRIVEITSPVTRLDPNYTGIITLPVEGELIQRNHAHRGLRPVSYNVDSPKYTCMQMLFRDES